MKEKTDTRSAGQWEQFGEAEKELCGRAKAADLTCAVRIEVQSVVSDHSARVWAWLYKQKLVEFGETIQQHFH